MKARRLHPPSRIVARAADPDGREEAWCMGDLPAGLQAELGARMIQAEQGEGLLPYDEAIAEVDRMAEEILAIGSAASR